MMDVDPRSTASRALRASVGLTALAAALLVCGAAVEVTGNLLVPPATAVQPTHTRSRASEAPSPDRPPPTSPAHLPSPTTTATATATATGSALNGR
ncbi:hypothetical protein OG607_24765 [Streptomyces sp. NBC_01537]|uniref:hypothetical protein n=1 Tax=Streptomyces sp. NBC_01537 TaxID=2903896 RepID=UPI00386F4E0C